MPLKTFRPLTPSNRYKQLPDFHEITKSKPEKSLCRPLKKSGGRNNQGRITCRHRGGGHKRKYRLIDFKRNKPGEATVLGIEYDPNRTARIALIQYADGTKSYILAPRELSDGDKVSSGDGSPVKPGCCLTLAKIPTGTAIHNVELKPGQGGQIARSAGQSCMLSNRDGEYALVKLPSGEIRKINGKCVATVGIVGNHEHMNQVSGKAGRTRWRGIRPTVRGMCMNPVDHPNGGGEGKSKSGGGRQHLKSPWGHVKGQKTRKKYKPSNKFIVERRKNKKKRR